MLIAAFIAYLTYTLHLHPGWYWVAGLVCLGSLWRAGWGLYKAGKSAD